MGQAIPSAPNHIISALRDRYSHAQQESNGAPLHQLRSGQVVNDIHPVASILPSRRRRNMFMADSEIT